LIDTRECFVEVSTKDLSKLTRAEILRMLERRVARRLGVPTPLPFKMTMEREMSPNHGYVRFFPMPRYLNMEER